VCNAFDMIRPGPYVVDLASVDFSTPARLQDLQWTGDFTPVTV